MNIKHPCPKCKTGGVCANDFDELGDCEECGGSGYKDYEVDDVNNWFDGKTVIDKKLIHAQNK